MIEDAFIGIGFLGTLVVVGMVIFARWMIG